jgi:gluconolactonase
MIAPPTTPAAVPDPYAAADAAFNDLIDPIAWVERLHDGCRWAEGPVYFADLRCLLWSDIPNERMLRYDELSGAVSVFRTGSGHANGNTRDRQGRLITCEQGARRVVRTEHDGTRTVLADAHEGRRLNAPNDVVVRSDGTIWFSDPSYGISSDYVGERAAQELPGCFVFRLDPADGTLRIVADDFAMPNGLAFSPDESRLYVADSGFLTDAAAPRHIRAFDVGDDGGLRGGEVLYEVDAGIPDGFRVDEGGRLWIGCGDGVRCVSPEGERLGTIRIPEAAANLTFGGPKRNRLYITATTSLYAVYLNTRGVQRP